MTFLRLLIIADVGGAETRHIGDEAMLEANLAAFRKLIPEVAFTVVSRDPDWTAARYDVDAVPLFGFPRDPAAAEERGALLHRLLASVSNRERGNTNIAGGNATSDAVARADGLIVSGGGNLSSTWPDLLYERATLLHLARIFEKPAVVLGQTLGPELSGAERRLLAETLSSARFVGLRELPSAVLAQELGVPPERLWYQCDDALFGDGLEGSRESLPFSAPTPDHSAAPIIAITIDPQIRAANQVLFASLVAQLRQLAKATGAALLLVPHMFGNETTGVPSDLAEAGVLAEALGLSDTVIAAGLDADRARQITGDASLVISSRYHPIVFALAGGVPAIGIYGDDYCRIKVQGALTHAQLDGWTVTYDAVVRGELLTKALELWSARAKVRGQLNSARQTWAAESCERWAAIINALDATKAIPAAGPHTMFGRPAQRVAAALVSTNEARRQWLQAEREAIERLTMPGRNGSEFELEGGMKRSISRYWSVVRSKLKAFLKE